MDQPTFTCPECGRSTRKLYRTLCGGCYGRHKAKGTRGDVPLKPVHPRLLEVKTRVDKVCPSCGERKVLAEFNKNVRKGDGLTGYCRVCLRDRVTERAMARRAMPVTHGGTVTCQRCTETLPEEQFYWRSDHGLRTRTCKPCVAVLSRRRNAKNADEIKSRKLLKAYGVTLEEYQALIAAQGGVCAICQRPETRKRRSLAVDHCHDSGKVRGVLCLSCNSAIGLLQESPELLLEAATYLRRHQS